MIGKRDASKIVLIFDLQSVSKGPIANVLFAQGLDKNSLQV